MERDEFLLFIQEISNTIRDRPLDAGLESLLNARFPDESPQFTRLVELNGEKIVERNTWQCSHILH